LFRWPGLKILIYGFTNLPPTIFMVFAALCKM
jgi:hypothetical protein